MRKETRDERICDGDDTDHRVLRGAALCGYRALYYQGSKEGRQMMMTTPMSKDELVKELLPALSMIYSSAFNILAALLSMLSGLFTLLYAVFSLLIGLVGFVMWLVLVARTAVSRGQRWADKQANSYRLRP